MPRPKGFRVRVVCGHTTKVVTRTCANDCNWQKDFVGYPINLASRLLDVSEDTACVCHESVREIVGEKKMAEFEVNFKRLDAPKLKPLGVDAEDLDELYSYDTVCLKPKKGNSKNA